MKLSVVIPVYNAERGLRRCVESVLRAGMDDMELILVDDGSSDGSGDLCRSLAISDSRIRTLSQANGGAAAARKSGVAAAVGEWIMFVDADDLLEPDAISGMLAVSEGVDIVVGHYHEVPDGVSPLGLEQYRRSMILNDDRWPVAPWAHLYRRELFSPSVFDVPRDVVLGEDWLMSIRLAFACRTPVGAVYRKVYEYVRSKGSVTGRNRDTLDARERFRALVLGSIPAAELKRYMPELALSELNFFDIWVHSNPGRKIAGHPYIGHLLSDLEEGGVGMPGWMSRIVAADNGFLRNRFEYWFGKKKR